MGKAFANLSPHEKQLEHEPNRHIPTHANGIEKLHGYVAQGSGATPQGAIMVKTNPFTLTVSKRQMEIFRTEAMQRFEHEMLIYLRESFPSPFAQSLGDAQMRRFIRFGVGLAGNHGFTLRGPVRLYLELMLLFGSHFDTDPQYPWGTEILANQDHGSEMRRAEVLYEKAMDYQQNVAGPNDVYALHALRNIAAFLRQPIPVRSATFAFDMLRAIENLYPQKAAYVGKEGMEGLIIKGIRVAEQHYFASVSGTALITVLTLTLGHLCGADPLYPWVANTLKETTRADYEMTANRLHEKTLDWIDTVLAYHEQDQNA